MLPAIKVKARKSSLRAGDQEGGGERKGLEVAFHESIAAELLVETRVLKKLAKLRERPYMRKKLAKGNFSFLELGLDKRGATRRRKKKTGERLAPVYLRSLFKKLQVEITKTEFVWLMRKLDPHKVGGARAEDLLRMIEAPEEFASREGGVNFVEEEADGDGNGAESGAEGRPEAASEVEVDQERKSDEKPKPTRQKKVKVTKREKKRRAQEKREHREAMDKLAGLDKQLNRLQAEIQKYEEDLSWWQGERTWEQATTSNVRLRERKLQKNRKHVEGLYEKMKKKVGELGLLRDRLVDTSSLFHCSRSLHSPPSSRALSQTRTESQTTTLNT